MKPKKETKRQREIREKTANVYYQNSICIDCGERGVCAAHWGPLVPPGTQGLFCPDCWNDRKKDGEKRKRPKPLGYKKEKVES